MAGHTNLLPSLEAEQGAWFRNLAHGESSTSCPHTVKKFTRFLDFFDQTFLGLGKIYAVKEILPYFCPIQRKDFSCFEDGKSVPLIEELFFPGYVGLFFLKDVIHKISKSKSFPGWPQGKCHISCRLCFQS